MELNYINTMPAFDSNSKITRINLSERKQEVLNMKQTKYTKLTIEGKCVEIYPSTGKNCPVIYLNTVSAESEAVLEELKRMECPDFSLVVISNLQWDHDMSPWDIPPILPGDTPCTGGADAYLNLLINEIIPKAEEKLSGITWRGIAGYSLAGLFAIYSMYHTDVFSRIASMSGSLWFPEFKEYVMSHELKKRPKHLYFSLGDKESKTRNPYLKSVQTNTRELVDYYRKQQIDTNFILNSGSHFTEPIKRSAMGIKWLLSR